MDNQEILSQAIKEKKQIEFEYLKEGLPIGKRFGNPHAMYIYSENTNNIAVDIFQINGVSSNPQSLPSFRQFIVSKMRNITIIDNSDKFEISTNFNSYSPKYNRPLIVVK